MLYLEPPPHRLRGVLTTVNQATGKHQQYATNPTCMLTKFDKYTIFTGLRGQIDLRHKQPTQNVLGYGTDDRPRLQFVLRVRKSEKRL